MNKVTKYKLFVFVVILSPVICYLPIQQSSRKIKINNNFLLPSYNSNLHPTLGRLKAKNELTTVEVVNKIAEEKKKKININALEFLDNCNSASQAQRILEKELLLNTDSEKDIKALYKSISIPSGASIKGISDGDLAIQTRLGNKKYKITELIELNGNKDIDRASISIFIITITSIITSIIINQNLPGPDIIRFILVWLITFLPLIFIGYGINDIEKLQTILVTIQRNIFPAYNKRMIQHEAGHFLIGHLLGWPISGYKTNAIKNAVSFYPLSDIDKGRTRANLLGFDKPSKSIRLNEIDEIPLQFDDVPFFSDQGRGGLLLEERSVFRKNINNTNTFSKLSFENDPVNSWPFRGFDDSTLDQLAVISVAGVCSEILAFGNAEGGTADIAQLKQIFLAAENSGTTMTDREIENRIKYSLGYTISQLRRHLCVLDDLANVMEKGGSVAECIVAIENCNNPSGQTLIDSNYELTRRKIFRSQKFNIFERIFIGNDKNIDEEEDRLIQGKGGGSQKETFRLTGDDPFYVAIATSLAFFAWASNGGLSLH